MKIKDFEYQGIAMLDSGADLNCAEQGIIPSKYFEKIKASLSAANSSKLQVKYKIPQAYICNNNICFKTSLMLVKDLNTKVKLGNPFLQMLYPFTVSKNGVEIKVLGQQILFKFLYRVIDGDVNNLQRTNITKINTLQQQIKFLKENLLNIKIEEQLQQKNYKELIAETLQKFENNLCSDLPIAFWERRKHVISLPYEKDFDENQYLQKPDQYK